MMYFLSVFVGIKFRGFRAFLAIRKNKFLREFVPAKIKPLKVVLFVLVLKMDSVDMMSTRPEGDTLCHQNNYSNAFLADETSSLHASCATTYSSTIPIGDKKKLLKLFNTGLHIFSYK